MPVQKVKNKVRNIQVIPVIKPSTPAFGLIDYACSKNVQFHAEFQQKWKSSWDEAPNVEA